jgi:pimeloyl-ACP methyl ester carboxylesterase
MAIDLTRRAAALGLTGFAAMVGASRVAHGQTAAGQGGWSPPEWETRQFTSSDGTVLKYRIVGEGRPLVIVHGGNSSASSYYAVAKLLKDQYRAYILERRSYGVSEESRSPNSYMNEAKDVHGLIDVIGADTFLFGHSAGSLVSLCAALDPRRISKLALYEPPILALGDEMRPVRERFAQLLGSGERAEAMIYAITTVSGIGRPEIEAFVRGAEKQGGGALDHLVHVMSIEMECGAQLPHDPERWAGLKPPVLFLLGAESPQHPLRDSTLALRKVLPGSRLVDLPGQGHNANLSAPQLVADALKGFFV